MTQNTKIEWADHTFNPWWGCTKISPACDHCYAAALDKCTGGDHWGAGQPRKRTSAKNWLEPVKWNKQADAFFAAHGRRQRVFCASMADVFDNEVDPQWRMDLFELIACTPNLDWLILTKRIGNVMSMCSGDSLMFDLICERVWLGATICNQEEADRDIPKLLATPAAKRFLSIEPMLGAIDLTKIELKENHTQPGLKLVNYPTETEALRGKTFTNMGFEYGTNKLDWVICGGESGLGARPMHPDWARSLRDQCDRACVPFYFKQWGEWGTGFDAKCMHEGKHSDGRTSKRFHFVKSDCSDCKAGDDGHMMEKVGKKTAGRMLDGVEHNGTPIQPLSGVFIA